MESGYVESFINDRWFGFIRVDGSNRKIFFHRADYRPFDGGKSRSPQPGERVVFKTADDNGRPKASPWAFENEYKPRFKTGDEPLEIPLQQIPFAGHGSEQEGDLYVTEIARSGDNPTYWDVVMYRPTTGELFQIRCWDGSETSYTPEHHKSGDFPTGLTVVDTVTTEFDPNPKVPRCSYESEPGAVKEYRRCKVERIDAGKGWIKENLRVAGMTGTVLSATRNGSWVSVTVKVILGTNKIARTEDSPTEAEPAKKPTVSPASTVSRADLENLKARFATH